MLPVQIAHKDDGEGDDLSGGKAQQKAMRIAPSSPMARANGSRESRCSGERRTLISPIMMLESSQMTTPAGQPPPPPGRGQKRAVKDGADDHLADLGSAVEQQLQRKGRGGCLSAPSWRAAWRQAASSDAEDDHSCQKQGGEKRLKGGGHRSREKHGDNGDEGWEIRRHPKGKFAPDFASFDAVDK